MSLGLKEYSLPPELSAIALRELNETPATRREGLRELRKKVAATDDNSVVEDAFLLRFLRCKKFDIGRSFSVYQRYHRFRSENPDIFEDLEPRSIRHIWDDAVIGALPSRDKKGRSIMVGFAGRWKPSEHSQEDALRAMILTLEHLIESEETQVNGIVLIADFKDFSLHQARCLRPWYFQLMTSLVQNAFPARFKGVYIVNQPWYISILLSLLRPFLSEKMNNRIHLLGNNIQSLHEYFDPDTLPEQLAGSLPPYEGREWAETMIEAHEYKDCVSNMEESAHTGMTLAPGAPCLLKSRETVV